MKKILFLLPAVLGMTLKLFSQVTPGSVVVEPIDQFLATPAANHVKTIPVIILRYLPTIDGINLDVARATDYWSLGEITLDQLKSNIDTYLAGLKFSLEEGSKFHGYKDPDAVPYLGYKVLKFWTIYDQVPISNTFQVGTAGGYPVYQPDFIQVYQDFGLQQFIEQNGVKEVWIWFGQCAMPGWPSYNPQIHLPENFVEFVESNMASPATGDISNSWRFPDDIPICSKTVVVYCYNFRRFQAEAVHDHGHQLESIYKYVAEQQDGSYNLFVHDFSGWGEFYSSPPIGRAGDCHHPPNTTQDYDYLNMTLVESDIEDWSPEIGPKKSVNAATWGNLSYDWPQGYYFPALTESQWYIYWMQNMPGYLNEIPYYDDGYMSNWWQFTDNWDSCHALNLGLHASTLQYRPCPGVPAVTDPRNGKTYHTVKIGNQCWMQENMDIGTRITGSQNQLSNSIIEKYCQQDNEVNCSVYGGLYQWAEALQYYNGASNTTAWSTPPSGIVRGICPEGWHIPTLAEWTQLTDYLGGLSVAGGKMKEAGTTHWVSPNTGATNSSWFTALPGGSHWGPGGFYYFPTNALFWTATEGSATGAWYRILGYDWAGVSGWPDGGKIDGFAVRCLYDAVQANLNLQNITVPVSTYNCYNALQTITVAGGGTTFLVQEGGDAMLIAGEKILLEPGTKVDPYGHLWGYITTDNTYCYTKAPAFVAKESRQETTSEVGKEPSGSLTIKPNPASETILVEIPGHEDLREETIRIYTSSGRLVLEETFRGTSPFEIHIGRLPAGLYLARIRGGEKEWSSKIVKTQR